MSALHMTKSLRQLDPLKLEAETSCITELNKRFAVAKVGGKTLVLDTFSEALDALSFRDFENMYNNVDVMVGKSSSPLGKYWLCHANRRQFLDGITFQPGTIVAQGQYNLWSGFAVEPDDTADCSLFLEHLKTVICSGNDIQNEYFLNWLALMVQHPGRLPEVAIGLLSAQGTGKGLFMQYLGKLLGRHYKHITDKNHLLGNFSGHLHDAVLVFADELSWTGNKSDAAILKALITEPTRFMEKKFADAIQVKNCTHLIIASNDAYAIPAELTDRRYCVLDVADCKKEDHSYFHNLAGEMNSGGPSGLLATLQRRDISLFRPSDFPKTSVRTEQQLQSLPSVETWFFECLQTGSIQNTSQCWPERQPQKDVYQHFCDWFNKRREPGTVPRKSAFTSTLKTFGVVARRQASGDRLYEYGFLPMENARAKFEKVLGSDIDWEES
jgi:hypothetical protein